MYIHPTSINEANFSLSVLPFLNKLKHLIISSDSTSDELILLADDGADILPESSTWVGVATYWA